MVERGTAGAPPPSAAATVEPSSSEPHLDASGALERVLELVDAAPPTALSSEGLSVGKLLELSPTEALLGDWQARPLGRAALAEFLEPELLSEAHAEGRPVLVETRAGRSLVVGVLQTSRPRTSELRGRDVHIEAENDLVLKSGRAALRLRADGTVELSGTRISAVSRGVLRLLGRALRLN